MKKLLWLALPVAAICHNEILTLLILCVAAVVGLAVLLKAAADLGV